MRPLSHKKVGLFSAGFKPFFTAVNMPERLPGIDMKAGLARVGGNARLYRKLLLDFRGSYANYAALIDSALAEKDVNKAASHAHTVKGVAGNIGAVLIQETAKTLEKSLKLKQKENLDRQRAMFAEAVREVITGLAVLEAAIPPHETDNKEADGMDRPVDIEALASSLRQLANQLDNFDTEADETLETLLKLLGSARRGPLAERLVRLVGDLDYAEAATLLPEFAATCGIPLDGDGVVDGDVEPQS